MKASRLGSDVDTSLGARIRRDRRPSPPEARLALLAPVIPLPVALTREPELPPEAA
jgi:hypothetical protein